MTTTTPPPTTGEPVLRRHPVRGGIWGLVMGIGVALILVDRALIAIGTLPPLLVVLLFVVLGVIWGLVAPPRTKGTPPLDVAISEAEPSASGTEPSDESRDS